MAAPDEGLGAHAERIRASDAERDLVIGELREQYAKGRLTHDTFDHRIDAALRARVRGELHHLVADLPARRRLRAAVWDTAVSAWRRAVEAADRWTRKAPATMTLPAGSQLRFTIGREPACDMRLEDMTVSRWHASLMREDHGWTLSDLGSTNGTRLNGWRVTAPTAVMPGDLVSFGAATFVLRERPGRASLATTG